MSWWQLFHILLPSLSTCVCFTKRQNARARPKSKATNFDCRTTRLYHFREITFPFFFSFLSLRKLRIFFPFISRDSKDLLRFPRPVLEFILPLYPSGPALTADCQTCVFSATHARHPIIVIIIIFIFV